MKFIVILLAAPSFIFHGNKPPCATKIFDTKKEAAQFIKFPVSTAGCMSEGAVVYEAKELKVTIRRKKVKTEYEVIESVAVE